jgi:hypothetical protein
MNRDDIIRMAQEAGWSGDALEAWMEGFLFGVIAEREECAKVCLAIASGAEVNGNTMRMVTAEDCADLIRERNPA